MEPKLCSNAMSIFYNMLETGRLHVNAFNRLKKRSIFPPFRREGEWVKIHEGFEGIYYIVDYEGNAFQYACFTCGYFYLGSGCINFSMSREQQFKNLCKVRDGQQSKNIIKGSRDGDYAKIIINLWEASEELKLFFTDYVRTHQLPPRPDVI